MTLLNISEYCQYVVRGRLILGAVLLNTIQLVKACINELEENNTVEMLTVGNTLLGIYTILIERLKISVSPESVLDKI